ncbi:hypothetical protein [Mycolicibacterium sarraceniae]|uniref:hypothetical protein n=1 Tax=Mycolicibacterium sarraceniae TaxID=1534348 RepID=UPI001F35CF12|nr:hypothetical protein [Mycolicibacterium sarraceniae]
MVIGTGFGKYAAAPAYQMLGFDFPPAPRRSPPPALSSILAQVADAVRTGTQLAPSSDDGVAVAPTMDQLRAMS